MVSYKKQLLWHEKIILDRPILLLAYKIIFKIVDMFTL